MRVVKGVTDFGALQKPLVASGRMFATVTLLTLVSSVSGTPYISGGDSPRGTDCSGLVSWVSNAASGRPIYGDRFNTGNIERALLARGFKYGTQPGALTGGDGGAVGQRGGGVRIGGGGAFQRQFSHHMYLPMAPEDVPPAPDAMPAPEGMPFMPPPPDMVPPPAPEAPVVLMAQEAPAPEMAPPAPAPEMAPPPPPADPFAPPPPPADPFAPPAPADLPAPA